MSRTILSDSASCGVVDAPVLISLSAWSGWLQSVGGADAGAGDGGNEVGVPKWHVHGLVQDGVSMDGWEQRSSSLSWLGELGTGA